jgi:hypothetical protein
MDAAVAAVTCVEDNRDDHGVGTGGIPNVSVCCSDKLPSGKLSYAFEIG